MNDELLAARPDHARDTQLQALRASHDNTLWVHFGNILLGCWLITAPAILGYSDSDFPQRVFDITQERGLVEPMLDGGLASTLNSMVVGILVIALTLPRGPIRNRYGSWNRLITW